MSIHQRSSRTVTEDMLPMSSFPSSRSVTTQSRYSDDDLSYATPMETDSEQQVPRPSVSVSLSEYSAASPTASAFHDALFGSAYRPPSSLSRRSYVPSIAPMQQPEIAVSPPICLSPPPRVSSTALPTVLPPPPRSPARKPICRPSTSSCASHTSPEPGRRSRASTAPSFTSESAQYDTVHTSNTPPVPLLPLAERRGQGPSLSLQIPSDSISPSLHSAPAPASPDFFDRIQSHPNAMDDLETSDESDDEENAREETATVFVEPRTQAVSNRASSSSSPHASPSSFAITEPLPRFELDRKKPIGNIPLRNNFFAARKKGMKGNTNTPLLPIGRTSSSSVHAFGIGEAGTSSHPAQRKRPATATEAEDRVRRWQRESLQKFDGMLVQHLAAERDTIKRITSNISNSKS
ncbi:hypothetical protein A0H81_07805 [Grifola frondosa]|uniref:Uncharacterized protein n=1 Tax=Grifola frondosa TaxID=5627 RepID=A0A1C7M6W8_GRIFR|nr:hypothetical protein A0H81_07805 [Grifola frondosa]